ncbi:hypothetical protein QBC40DRAFT_264814 [Triangularia verruculosa]|uniref:Uncharacterized protein n=1 Tax=Triangularia verruculosa TaxID=2587418 RepID=A0AAN6XI26_9PEZI|nr:hypothetical protein QBC40DRAFT_264814 [Triangularia verruculosa]
MVASFVWTAEEAKYLKAVLRWQDAPSSDDDIATTTATTTTTKPRQPRRRPPPPPLPPSASEPTDHHHHQGGVRVLDAVRGEVLRAKKAVNVMGGKRDGENREREGEKKEVVEGGGKITVGMGNKVGREDGGGEERGKGGKGKKGGLWRRMFWRQGEQRQQQQQRVV